ncbi:hypothetical protein ACFL04_00955 [Patescibacteria group bacterium]
MSTSRVIGLVVALVTAAANWLVFYWVAVKFGSPAPEFIAWIVLLSVVLHEIGHLIVLEANGIKTYLVFLVILGGAIPDPKHKDKYLGLPHHTLAQIYLAGVTLNLLMVLGSVVLYWLGDISARELGQITNLSGIMILFNLLPIWIFDGGRFAKIFFDSSPEDKDTGYVIKFTAIIGVVFFLLTLLTEYSFIFSLLLLFWGLHFRANHDDPMGSHSKQAMSKKQLKGWAYYYAALMILAAYFMASTDKWYISG